MLSINFNFQNRLSAVSFRVGVAVVYSHSKMNNLYPKETVRFSGFTRISQRYSFSGDLDHRK